MADLSDERIEPDWKPELNEGETWEDAAGRYKSAALFWQRRAEGSAAPAPPVVEPPEPPEITDEEDALRFRLSQLLTGVANALRGEPPPLTSWSWHDLPERAAAAIAMIDVLQRALAAPVVPSSLTPDPLPGMWDHSDLSGGATDAYPTESNSGAVQRAADEDRAALLELLSKCQAVENQGRDAISTLWLKNLAVRALAPPDKP